MRNLKRTLSLALAAVMLMGMMVVGAGAASSDFTDASDIKNVEAVDVMVALGVLEGGDKGDFQPNSILTREQAAKIICYLLLGTENAEKLAASGAVFNDVAANRWSAPYIGYCVNLGILAGDGQGNFFPEGKLTGAAFAKMLLVALGYDAKIENYVGSDWMINVASDAIEAGIVPTGLVLGNELSRQNAAQMAFQTLTAVLVDYKGGTNVTTGDGTTVVVDSERYNVTTASGTGYKMGAANDGYVQFCERYFSTLKLNVGGKDELDRPADEWIYANKSVGAYATTPAVVYTADMDTTSGKKTVKSDLKNYYYGGTAAGSKISSTGNVTPVDNIDTSDEVAALTANGRSVEIYVTDNVITDIVAIDSKLVTVKKVTKDEVTFVGAGVNAVKEDDSLFGFFSDLKKDDKAVVVLNDTNDIVEAYVPETVTGKFTKIKGTGDTTEYTVDGTVYQAATGSSVSSTLKASNLNNTYTLTLDKYGYILAVSDEEVADDVYGYVMDASANVNRGEYDYALKVLFADGTIKWIDVAEVTDSTHSLTDAVVADGEVSEANFITLKDKYISYSEGENGYDVTNEGVTPVSGAITKGEPTIFTNKTASNKTIFLVKDGSSYTVYTGIKNVPSMNVASGKGYALLEGNVAIMVVIDKSSSTSNKDQVFIYDTTVVGTEKDGSTVVKYYNALVNGEDTTIGVKDGEPVAVGLFVNNSYSGEYISTLGTKYDAAASDTDSVKVFDNTVDGLADLKLKNGILTVDQTSDETFVMADEYESWLVKGTSKEVGALSLSSDGVVADEGVTVNAGDYVVVVLDGDGYVSNLFLVDMGA